MALRFGRERTLPQLVERLVEASQVTCRALPRVLVIDDDVLLRRAIVRSLRRAFVVEEAEGAAEALALLSVAAFDVVLCDVHLRGMAGPALLAVVARTTPDAGRRWIMMSGDPAIARDPAMRGDVRHYLEKPTTAATLLGAIERVLIEAEAA